MTFNIDRKLCLERSAIRELNDFASEYGFMLNENENDYRPDGMPSPRNLRRRYYRLLDRITGEPGRFGNHYVCSGNIGEVYFEHRR